MINTKGMEWLEARGLDVELAVRLGVKSLKRNGCEWLEIPYIYRGDRVNAKFRNIEKKEHFQEPDGKKVVYNFDCLLDRSLEDQPLIITEGEWDCMAALQSGYGRVISVPDGAPAEIVTDGSVKYSYLGEVLKLIADTKEVIIAADSDGPGHNLLHDLSVRIGKARCKWVPYPKGCKDLGDALRTYGTRGVVDSLNRASWVTVDGVYRMSELTPLPDNKPYSTGFQALDPHYKVRMADFCVVTGIPSHGKSTFITDICARMAHLHKFKTCFASFEQHPYLDHRRNLRKWFISNDQWTADKIKQADKWIDDNFVFMVPSDDDEVDLHWVLEKAQLAVVRHGCNIVSIDPWNEMDHMRPKDMSLTEYTGYAIKRFKAFARQHNIHLIVAAHPAKMKRNTDGGYDIPSLYDISDSAHWYNKADVGIVVHRISETESLIRVAKSRYHDIIGVPGEIDCMFNKAFNRFEKI